MGAKDAPPSMTHAFPAPNISQPLSRCRKPAMPRFLAVYTMKPEDLARWYTLSEAERKARDEVGLKAWAGWEEANAGSFPNRGGMVGRTTRVTKDGVSDARNNIAGYIVVEAESAEAAARLFENHPHFTTFPGDGVDIMPFLTPVQD